MRRRTAAEALVAVAAFLVILGGAGCDTAHAEPPAEVSAIASTLSDLRSDLPEFRPHEANTNPAARAYFDYYGLCFEEVVHAFGGLDVDGQRIAVHTFEPADPKATILVAHGYFDHAGIWNHAIEHFLTQSYAVLVFDFPGHGLSPGKRGDIADFSDYLAVLAFFDDYAQRHMAGPVHLVGHSMGAGTIVEYVLRRGLEDGRRAVLVAPNIRSSRWGLSRLANAIARPFVDEVQRVHRASSHDEAFIAFREHYDPLQTDTVPLHWFGELVEWNREMSTLEPREAAVRAIQGTEDGTVSWRYNLRFLRRKIPGLDVVELAGGEHHLINESPALRSQTLRLITAYLAE